MTTILNWLNEQHWYIIAGILLIGLLFWIYGCESQVKSLIDPAKKVNRAELQVELDYLVGQAKCRVADLNKQDELKQALLDALVAVGEGGQINALGLVNLAATIGAISFGLNRNQKYKASLANKSNTANTAAPA
jgi:hypothetical protein